MKKFFWSAAAAAALFMAGCDNGSSSGTSSDTADTNDTESNTSVVVNNPDLGGGKILLYTTGGTFIDAANVGNLPDMVKFSHDGKQLLSANEGEPLAEDDDPEGSVSIITLADDKTVQDVTTLFFDDTMLEDGVRIQPEKNASIDIEPEYIAISEDGARAWVTLQENNAVAYIDIAQKKITAVKGLGSVDLNQTLIDIVDDGEAKLQAAPANIFALYMPDTIQSYNVGGNDYFVTANEGDDRDYDWYADYVKANSLDLSAELQAALLDTDSEKLRVLTDLGMNAEGVYEALYMTGTRSFTIRDAEGAIVFDSGAAFETELAAHYADVFNTRVDDTDDADDIADMDSDGTPYSLVDGTAYFWEGIDARSLKKGSEPEALALATIGEKTFAYIGQEKQGGFFVYDITDPAAATMVEYFNDINYSKAPAEAGDLAPEGTVTFEQDGAYYLAAGNELSSTLSLYSLGADGKMAKVASIAVGTFGAGAAEIVDYSPSEKKIFVTNGEAKRVDIFDVSDPSLPSQTGSIDFSAYANALQSLSVKDGVVAIAVE